MSRTDRPITHDTSEMNVLFVHSALDDYPLTPEEFRVYAHLARRASSGAAYPSIPNMAKACRIHPDTVRKVLSNLLAYQLIEAHERKGRTTLYTLTKFSRWIKREGVLKIQAAQEAEGKLKRAEKKVRKIMADQINPPETKGGVLEGVDTATPPKRREGYPSETEGGDPPETKGDEGNPLRRSIEGGVLDVTGKGPERGKSLSAPVTQSNNDQYSSSNDAALQTSTHEAEPAMDSPAGLPLPQVPSSQSLVLEQPSPDGVTADAALDPDSLDEEFESLFASGASTESVENVPGGAAASEQAAEAPRGPAVPPVSLSVAELSPIPAAELAARPVATPEGKVWNALREVLGNQMLTYLGETTRTGNLSRKLWLKLNEVEIQQVTRTARLEAALYSENMITLTVRGLDRLIGAVKAPKPEGKSAAGEKVLGPVELNHLDPHLLAGARCSVNGALGVVKSVLNYGYIVEFDSGDMATVDRFVAAHLSSLKASTAPCVATVTEDDVVVLAKVGSSYRDLSTGVEVQVTAVRGANRVLSSGFTLACYELLNPARFERLTI